LLFVLLVVVVVIIVTISCVSVEWGT